MATSHSLKFLHGLYYYLVGAAFLDFCFIFLACRFLFDITSIICLDFDLSNFWPLLWNLFSKFSGCSMKKFSSINGSMFVSTDLFTSSC